MNERERKLAGIIAAIVVLYGAWWLYSGYGAAMRSRNQQLSNAEQKLAEVKRAVQKGRMAAQKIGELQKRSLPADRDRAQSLYKAWLLSTAKTAGVTVNDIKLAARPTSSTAFDAVGYAMEANGPLPAVVSMLYEFYHSPILHQITKLRLARPLGATQMQVTLEVEALCLKGAEARDALPEGASNRLKLASAADYQKSLVERDLATVYMPPRPPAPPPTKRDTPPPPPKFDEAELARFSGTINNGERWQAWINNRATGETLHLYAGDKVKIGALEGTIESVEERILVLNTGDKKYRVVLGESLRSGKELDADGKVKAEPVKEEPKS
jgi:hypothetical protein